MTFNRWQHAMPMLCVLLCVCVIVGCGEQQETAPPPPDEVILYALDFRVYAEADDIPNGEDPIAGWFQYYKIIGQVDLTGTDEGNRLAEVMANQHLAPEGIRAACLNPRQGLRVVQRDVTTDYVLCYECGWYEWHSNDPDIGSGWHYVPNGEYDAFTAPLTEAGIELAE